MPLTDGFDKFSHPITINHSEDYSLFLLGDFDQLPPIMDISLYACITESSHSVLHRSFRLYRDSFTRAFESTQQMGQQGEIDMDLRFQRALLNICMGEIQKEDSVLSSISISYDDQ